MMRLCRKKNTQLDLLAWAENQNLTLNEVRLAKTEDSEEDRKPIHKGYKLTKLAGKNRWYREFTSSCGTLKRQYFNAWICDLCGKKTFTSTNRDPRTKHSFCSHACKVSFLKGTNHPNWAGGFVTSNGYLHVKIGDSYVSEHVHVMQQHLGRELNSEEIVHHIDCDKTNNAIENLVVVTKSQHSSAHMSVNGILSGLIKAGIVWFDRDRMIYRSTFGERNIRKEDDDARAKNERRNGTLSGKRYKKVGLPRRLELIELLKKHGIDYLKEIPARH